jgi:hypothetical protein
LKNDAKELSLETVSPIIASLINQSLTQRSSSDPSADTCSKICKVEGAIQQALSQQSCLPVKFLQSAKNIA